ncbi:prephenate dehydratase [Neisseria sp. Ec49-e6-T10]|uniref:prephenate dehydratase n=1 Tax=Neisseria sp. Ec49-e6-T10 TaxID=3140744 RepID=UPI003EC0EF2C
MSDDQLQPHRQAIDNIDQEILTLLNKRAEHAHAIGALKGSGVVYRPEREAQVLKRIQSLNSGLLPNEAVARLFREIMSECLAVERPLTIAYLGPEGTFSQLATTKHFGHAAKTQACHSIDDAFRLVEARQADYVVAPIENSTEGAVGRTLDLLVASPLKACGEVMLRIHHHLLNKDGDMSCIKEICAHPQALGQCHEWLNRNLPASVKRVPVSSNAEAAKIASEHNHIAAIASQAAAERYHLIKIASNIEDEPNNTTRFLVLGHQLTDISGHDKTSLIVSVAHRAGSIYELLKVFAEHGVSMTKFESRPSRTGLWEYVFFIDIEGHQKQENVAQSLTELESDVSFIKIIGSYPIAVL